MTRPSGWASEKFVITGDPRQTEQEPRQGLGMRLLEEVEDEEPRDHCPKGWAPSERKQEDRESDNRCQHAGFREEGDEQRVEVAVLVSGEEGLGLEKRIAVPDSDKQLFDIRCAHF